MDPGQPASVFMVAPFTTQDLNQRCMADVIFDLTELTFLYPNIHKESFKKFVTTKAPTTSSGYVNHNLVTRVEGAGGYAAPNAPNPYGYPYTPTPGAPEHEPLGTLDIADGVVGGMETGDSVPINYDNINIMDVLGQIDDFMPMVGPNQPFQS